MIGTLFQDLRYGARMLLKTPTITFIVILALALGIGANTAIFSVINGVLLRPLPFEDSDRLVFLTETNANGEEMSLAYPNFSDWRSQNHSFEKIGVYNRQSYNLTGAGEPERIITGQVSADLFSALKVNAALGRVFTNEEDQPGGPLVVVLSYGLWQRHFGGQSNIINQALTLNGKSYTVIGVMPQGYQFPSRVEMWVPAGQLSGESVWQQRANHVGLWGVARLKPGITLAAAQADMQNIAINLERQYPNINAGSRVKIQPLIEVFVSDVRPTLWVLFAAVAFVLLIACANIANLLLARASARQKEMAIRSAMGAGRWRLARQLLTEAILLALVGGTFALVLARWGVDLILYVSPDAIPRSREITLNWRVMLFTLGISCLTGILFGLVPALQSGAVDVQGTLKETGRGIAGRHWLRSSLVVVEISMTLVLLIGAGLMIRSFYRLQNVAPGFSYDQVTTFNVSLPVKKYATEAARADFYQRLLDNTRRLPGVEATAAASGLPLGNNGWLTSFAVVDRPVPPPSQLPLMSACLVTPDYFRAMNIPLKAGRFFTDRDDRSFLAGKDLSKLSEDARTMAGLNSIIIDDEFARRYWPKEDPLGKRVQLGIDGKGPILTVVGVVGRVRMDGLRQDSNKVQGYFPYAQILRTDMTVIVKAASDPNQTMAAVRQQLKEIDPNQPIYNIRSLNEIRGENVAPERLNLTLLGLFAGVALLLAIVGIYGVMSYTVTQRTHEIGIRMALGAQVGNVMRLVMKGGLAIAMVGVAIGLAGAFALTRLMRTLLFAIEPTDKATFAGVSICLFLIALVACYVPARRATKVDPLQALRYE